MLKEMTSALLMRLTVILAMFGVAGCVSNPDGGALGEAGIATVVTDFESMPVPSRAEIGVGNSAFALAPYDELTIDVFGLEGLEGREVTVDGQGYISFPLVGTVSVAGLTAPELTERLKERLRASYVRNPEVSVNLKESKSKFVSVAGQVSRPGLYAVQPSMTLMNAIAKAEGVSEFAAIDDVVILRTVDEKRYAALYNVAAIQRGNLNDPSIYPGDLVIVGESRQRRLFDTILQATPLLTTPLIILLQSGVL